MVTEHNCEDRCVTWWRITARPGWRLSWPSPGSAAASSHRLLGRGESAPVTSHCSSSQVNIICRPLYKRRRSALSETMSHTSHDKLCYKVYLLPTPIILITLQYMHTKSIHKIGLLVNFIVKLCDAIAWYLVNNLACDSPPVSLYHRKINIQFKMHCLSARNQDGQFMSLTTYYSVFLELLASS